MTPTFYSVLRYLIIPAFLAAYLDVSALICKNGVFITLDANGLGTLPAEQFVLDNNSCCSFGINYDISKDFGSSFQPSVSLTCDDLGQQPIQVKFTDCFGRASFCDTYVIVQGNLNVCDIGCGGCCLPVVITRALNFSLYDDLTSDIHASWFDDGSFSNCAPGPLQYSFSQNVADSVMTLNCDNLGSFPVQVWVTDAAGNQSYGEVFGILQWSIGDCLGTGPCLPAAVIHNGAVLPLGSEGEACIHARDIDAGSYVSPCSGASSYTVSFSANPNDTVLCFTCNDLGQQTIEFYIYDNLGNYNNLATYLIIEDVINNCLAPSNLIPQNDDVCNAYDIGFLLDSGCTEYFFNIGADAGITEVTPPLAACGVPNTWCDAATVAESTVWFKFEAPASEKITIVTEGMNTQLALWGSASCDSLNIGSATLIAANDDDPSIPNGGSKLEAVCLEAGKTYFLQMDGFDNSEGRFGLKFSSTGPACTNAAADTPPASLGFSVHPNPASNFVEVTMNQGENWQNSMFFLTDVSGKCRIAEKLTRKSQRIDINHLAPGIYFIHLKTERGISGYQILTVFR